LKNIIKTQPFVIKEESDSYAKHLDSYNSESSTKKIVYSKRRQTINDNPVYTISQNNENPPEINDLFNLKVRVPRVKVSKYFKEKYSNTRNSGSVLKLNDSQFMSNASQDEDLLNKDDYNQLSSPKHKSKSSLLTSNASAENGISSVVTNSIEKRSSMIKNYNKFSHSHLPNPVKFPDFLNQKSDKKLLGRENSFDRQNFSPKRNLTSNMSKSSYKENNFDQSSANKYNKLYEKMNKIQKMRLKMVNKIKEKAQYLKDKSNKSFEANVRVFNQKAEKEIEDMFRETKFQDRKNERLETWKSKKYRKNHEL